MPKKLFNKKTKVEKRDKKEETPVKPRAATPQLVRGMKDILPVDQPFWDWFHETVHGLATAYGYGLIETPLLEETRLFARSLGTTSDVVQKEMFSFTDAGGQEVTLRPESTASVVRAYIQHGMLSLPQPVKVFNVGPMFRHERPQAGRQREFHQASFEVLGEAKPVVDAEVIFLTYAFFQALGLPVTIQINSLGCTQDREEYRKRFLEYLKPERRALCEDCRERIGRNPLRVLDCKEEGCRRIATAAPQLVDALCEADKDHFMHVLEYLDEMEVPYHLNNTIVRGLDYYTRTIFEVWPELEKDAAPKAQESLGGGGRYDGLAEILGGRPTPGCGVSIGLERVIQYARHRQIISPSVSQPAVFFAQLGEPARRRAFKLFEQLRRAGFAVSAAFTKDGLKPQLEMANRLRVRYSVILGQKEVLDNTLIIRDMENGVQEVVDAAKIVVELQKRLGEAAVLHVAQAAVSHIDSLANASGHKKRSKNPEDEVIDPDVEEANVQVSEEEEPPEVVEEVE